MAVNNIYIYIIKDDDKESFKYKFKKKRINE